MTLNTRAMSDTCRASGPNVSYGALTGTPPRFEMRPTVGRRPATPQKAAGMRIEPPVSLPIDTTHMSVATDAPEPPLEPPGTRVVFQGFLQGPKCLLCVVGPNTHSCRFDLPMMIAPCCLSRLVMKASSEATLSRRKDVAAVGGTPARWMQSFRLMFMPCSSPADDP